MTLVVGLDTGGTFTDAALLDITERRVVASAKSLTTRHDLAITLAITLAIPLLSVARLLSLLLSLCYHFPGAITSSITLLSLCYHFAITSWELSLRVLSPCYHSMELSLSGAITLLSLSGAITLGAITFAITSSGAITLHTLKSYHLSDS